MHKAQLFTNYLTQILQPHRNPKGADIYWALFKAGVKAGRCDHRIQRRWPELPKGKAGWVQMRALTFHFFSMFAVGVW